MLQNRCTGIPGIQQTTESGHIADMSPPELARNLLSALVADCSAGHMALRLQRGRCAEPGESAVLALQVLEDSKVAKRPASAPRVGKFVSLEDMAVKSRAACYGSPSRLPPQDGSSLGSQTASVCSSPVASSALPCSSIGPAASVPSGPAVAMTGAKELDAASLLVSGDGSSTEESQPEMPPAWCAGHALAAISRLRSARKELSAAGGLLPLSPRSLSDAFAEPSGAESD